jgi:hypothetical protein
VSGDRATRVWEASPNMPARWVPLLYFTFAHLCLATALAALVFAPMSLVGFFYHPRMLAVVHLVTLGWISSSILGSIYIVGPLALRMPLPARGPDYAAFAGFAVGVIGMTSHFWLDLPSGMAWGAGLTALAMSYVAARGIVNLWTAPVPPEARLPVALALLNVIAAAVLGSLLAVDKVSPILKVNHLDAVFAHAHLAALGWGTMMVVGAGYRILPMILPAAMPRGFWAYASGLLLEAGVIGLVWGFFAGGRGIVVAGSLAVAGIGSFLSRVAGCSAIEGRRPRRCRVPIGASPTRSRRSPTSWRPAAWGSISRWPSAPTPPSPWPRPTASWASWASCPRSSSASRADSCRCSDGCGGLRTASTRSPHRPCMKPHREPCMASHSCFGPPAFRSSRSVWRPSARAPSPRERERSSWRSWPDSRTRCSC